jgi:hypothetical protein
VKSPLLFGVKVLNSRFSLSETPMLFAEVLMDKYEWFNGDFYRS